MTVRDSWTDERLDDLNAKVDRGFDRVDQRFEQVDHRFEQVDQRFEQVDQRFEQVDQRFEQVDQRFDRVETDIRDLRGEMNSRFDSLQRTMILGFAGMSASVVGAVLVVQL